MEYKAEQPETSLKTSLPRTLRNNHRLQGNREQGRLLLRRNWSRISTHRSPLRPREVPDLYCICDGALWCRIRDIFEGGYRFTRGWEGGWGWGGGGCGRRIGGGARCFTSAGVDRGILCGDWTRWLGVRALMHHEKIHPLGNRFLGAKPIVPLDVGDDNDDIEASSSIKYLLTVIKINYILFTIVYLI